MKIADFGISKRTAENFTALRTRTGTVAFVAPEVLLDDSSELEYTDAIDIWAMGVIAFLILTGKILFVDQHRGKRAQYINGGFAFPSEDLLANNVSQIGCDFVKRLMAVEAQNRPRAEEGLQSPWLASVKESSALESQRYRILSRVLL